MCGVTGPLDSEVIAVPFVEQPKEPVYRSAVTPLEQRQMDEFIAVNQQKAAQARSVELLILLVFAVICVILLGFLYRRRSAIIARGEQISVEIAATCLSIGRKLTAAGRRFGAKVSARADEK